MKNLCLLTVLLFLFSCSNKPMELNVMSFNIRMNTPVDGENQWPNRKDVAAQVVKINQVDLLGTQEVLPGQLNDLKQRLPNYNAIGVGREDGKEKGEFCAVFYRKDRFEEEKSGNFWLSETPEIAGSKGWDAACERVATWAVLKEKSSGRKIFYINTHLDHMGQTARREGVKLLLTRTKELADGLPVIITGDFNATPDSEVIKLITEESEFINSRTIAAIVSGNAGTFHNFGKVPVEKRNFIDYIFVSDNIETESFTVLPEKLDGILTSDHNPVMAKIIVR